MVLSIVFNAVPSFGCFVSDCGIRTIRLVNQKRTGDYKDFEGCFLLLTADRVALFRGFAPKVQELGANRGLINRDLSGTS